MQLPIASRIRMWQRWAGGRALQQTSMPHRLQQPSITTLARLQTALCRRGGMGSIMAQRTLCHRPQTPDITATNRPALLEANKKSAVVPAAQLPDANKGNGQWRHLAQCAGCTDRRLCRMNFWRGRTDRGVYRNTLESNSNYFRQRRSDFKCGISCQ